MLQKISSAALLLFNLGSHPKIVSGVSSFTKHPTRVDHDPNKALGGLKRQPSLEACVMPTRDVDLTSSARIFNIKQFKVHSGSTPASEIGGLSLTDESQWKPFGGAVVYFWNDDDTFKTEFNENKAASIPVATIYIARTDETTDDPAPCLEKLYDSTVGQIHGRVIRWVTRNPTNNQPTISDEQIKQATGSGFSFDPNSLCVSGILLTKTCVRNTAREFEKHTIQATLHSLVDKTSPCFHRTTISVFSSWSPRTVNESINEILLTAGGEQLQF